MSAEDLGKRLLAEVEEVGLNEIFSTLLRDDNSQESRFGVPQLDAMLQCIAETRSSTTSLHPTPPIIELQSLYPAGGKTHLLYHLTAIAVLPTSHGGKQSAVIILDTDGRFSIPRLAQQIKRQTTLNSPQPIPPSEIEDITLLALKHIHIFTPQSLNATIATITHLPTYLFNPTKHHSFDRTIAFIALDSASAFYWQHRTDFDDASLLPSTTSSKPNSYIQLAASLKNALRTLNTALVFTSRHNGTITKDPTTTTTSHLSPTDSQSLRSSLPTPWPTLPTLRLILHRAPVRKLPVEISIEDASRESETRQKVVEKGKMECFVNEFGVEAIILQKLRASSGSGGGFEFFIMEDGVAFED